MLSFLIRFCSRRNVRQPAIAHVHYAACCGRIWILSQLLTQLSDHKDQTRSSVVIPATNLTLAAKKTTGPCGGAIWILAVTEVSQLFIEMYGLVSVTQ
jgi:hypothetical protein